MPNALPAARTHEQAAATTAPAAAATAHRTHDLDAHAVKEHRTNAGRLPTGECADVEAAESVDRDPSKIQFKDFHGFNVCGGC